MTFVPPDTDVVPPDTDASSINIVIPMGGLSTSRFTNEQYRFPKPLVRICGREMLFWLLDHLSIVQNDTIWLALPQELDDQFLISNRIGREYPALDIRVVPLRFETRGAVETLYTVVQEMSQPELAKRTISLDCDTIYFSDILTQFRNLPDGRGASFCFEDTSGLPRFSYIKLDEERRVVDIREKVIISTHANTGAYGFESGKALQQNCAKRLDQDAGSLGEYYTSGVIKEMIRNDHVFVGIDVPDFACVSTPKQLQDFLVALKKKRNPEIASASSVQHAKRRFCFDLVGTLVTFPEVTDDFSTVRPMLNNIRLARELHTAGHTIIIQTARGMKEHNGNVAAVIAAVAQSTMEILKKFEIPYDELVFGKPHADMYIDENAVHAQMNTYKEIGWSSALPEDDKASGDGYWEEETKNSSNDDKAKDFVEPRSFNSIMKIGNTVIKAGPKEVIGGEHFFYQHIPDDLKHLFPKLEENLQDSTSTQNSTPQKNEKGNTFFGDQEIVQIRMEAIEGTPMSLLVLGKCLTPGRFVKFLDALKELHTFQGPTVDDFLNNKLDPNTVYLNYVKKLQQRFEKHAFQYFTLGGSETQQDYEAIKTYLQNYEDEDRAYHAKLLHGDPVFTNVLLATDGKGSPIKLLDMRGLLGPTLALRGDAHYDLSKVYQCLLGYDFWLHHQKMTERDSDFLSGLRAVFWDFVAFNYPQIRQDDIKMVTASLYFSMIPLHDSDHSKRLFLAQARKLIKEVNGP